MSILLASGPETACIVLSKKACHSVDDEEARMASMAPEPALPVLLGQTIFGERAERRDYGGFDTFPR